jgi:hypothetical protein
VKQKKKKHAKKKNGKSEYETKNVKHKPGNRVTNKMKNKQRKQETKNVKHETYKEKHV